MLLELLEQAESGHGQVVGLVGDPGVGKSRVVYEFRHALGARRVTVLEGRCLSYGSAIPYLPILDIVRANCGIVDTDTPEVVSEKVSAGLDELQIDARKNASYILYALGLKESTESLILLSGQAIKERTFDVLREMSVRGSRRRPLIFVVEDLHWIDTTSEEFLASLIERLPGVPILLLMTSRPGYRSPWSDKSYATQISLRPLSEEEGLGVVRAILMNRGVAESATPMILERAGGNPLFLEELSRAVLEHGAAEGLYSIPDTIQGVLMARIDRLPDEAKRLLQSAAVLGREFSPRLLSAVWDGSDVEPLITDLRRSEFLYERSHGDDSVYVFKHALTQEVAYASILTAHRERLHAVAGEVLERLHAERLEEVYDRLAFHFSKTKMIEKAVEYLSRLAERAARSYAHAEAVLAFTDAVALAERLPIAERDRRVLELILHQAQSFHYLGRRQELVDILEQYQERLERLGDKPLTGQYYSRLGFAYSFLGDRGRAGSAVMKAIAAAEECGDGVTLGTALVSVGMEKLWGGKVEEGIELLRRSIELLTPANEHESLGFAYYAMAWGQATRGDFDDARAVLDRLDAIGEATGDPRLQCNAATVRGWVEISTGEFTMGLRLLRYALERAPDPFEAALALGFLGYAHLESGEVGEATAVLERAVQEADKLRSRQVRAWFRTHLGEAYLARGQTEAAGDLCRQALDLSNEAQWRFGIAIAKRLLGRIVHASGAADADLYVREALALALELGVRHDVAHCHRVLGELYRQTGKRDQAREHLSAAITMYREIGMRYWLEKAEAGLKAVG